ncbi:Integron-associated effector binding protein domain-containing protein [Escherichia coli]
MKIKVTKAYDDNPKFISLNKSYGVENGDEFEVIDLFEDHGYIVKAPITEQAIIILRTEAVEVGSDEHQYDSPYMTEWIVAVDVGGRVSVLKAPNLHPGFTENGLTALDYGLPEDVENTPPGMYRWICSFHEEKDWESGLVDDWHFEVESSFLIMPA